MRSVPYSAHMIFRFLAASFFLLLCLPQARADDIEVIHSPCADTVMYPEAVVSLIEQCFKTDHYDDCLSYSNSIPPNCPTICKEAIMAERPYGKKVNELYNHGGGWLYNFSKGKRFGRIVGYANENCKKSPAVPKCYLLPICYGGIWNIMQGDSEIVAPAIDIPDPAASPAPLEPSRANGHEYMQRKECYQEVIFPPGVVEKLEKCKATRKSYNCGGAGVCPGICKLALSAQAPFVEKAYQYSKEFGGGSMMPFTRGDDFGMYVEHPYGTSQCPSAPYVPDCTKPICHTF